MSETRVYKWMEEASADINLQVIRMGPWSSFDQKRATTIIAMHYDDHLYLSTKVTVPPDVVMGALFPPRGRDAHSYMATIGLCDAPVYRAAGKCIRWGGFRFNCVLNIPIKEVMRDKSTTCVGLVNLSALTPEEFDYLCQQLDQIGAQGSSSWMRNYRDAGLIRSRPRNTPLIVSGSSDPDPIPSTIWV
jgi:hypothetical protein